MVAAITPIEPGGLARTYVEYELLPDLLALPGTVAAVDAPESWTTFLSERSCNLEHLPDEDMPSDEDIPLYLVADAWHLVRQLQLVTDDGLSPAGQHIADIAGTPLRRRHETGQLAELCATLAQQIRTCYRGQGELDITGLLQRGAGSLASTEHVWAAYCPGLLLVEFEVLVHLAVTATDQAIQVCDELLLNRDSAMHQYDMPSPDVLPMLNMVTHADAVAEFYLDNLQLLNDGGLGISVSRATAMLFTFCSLLQEVYPVGPVQCLAPPTS